MGNIQITTIGAGEVANPRVHVPRAMRRIFWRLNLFYIGSLLAVGLILPSTDPNLVSSSGTATSPFVLAFNRVGIKVLPSIINAVVVTSAFSSGNGVLFLASRVLVGLAQDGYAPKFLLNTNRFGSPWLAVLCSFALAPLGMYLNTAPWRHNADDEAAYLNCGTKDSTLAFSWFISLIATAGLIVWCVICFAYVRFYFGLKHHGISRDELPYKSWGQPYCAIAAGIFAFLILFFSGFTVFFPGHWSASSFISNYIACFLVPVLYVVLKVMTKSPWISYANMDFSDMEAVRAEAAVRASMEKTNVKWWRKLVEKVVDE